VTPTAAQVASGPATGRRRRPRARGAVVLGAVALLAGACACGVSSPGVTPQAASSSGGSAVPATSEATVTGSVAEVRPLLRGRSYPVHTEIVSTTFWVGEIFDPDAPDGSQEVSTYDASWMAHYGGCDGVVDEGKGCLTERRTAANGYFPSRMTPKENPFYLDLPFDDVHDETAFRQRCAVIPWAGERDYAAHCSDRSFSLMKNRWVRMTGPNGQSCYGQIEDAGPARYHDAAYVFGSNDVRPANTKYNGAGMDVSPALNGCLGFAELDGDTDQVDWQFVDEIDVPDGPWTRVITTRGQYGE
jgi:hypothetical protein